MTLLLKRCSDSTSVPSYPRGFPAGRVMTPGLLRLLPGGGLTAGTAELGSRSRLRASPVVPAGRLARSQKGHPAARALPFADPPCAPSLHPAGPGSALIRGQQPHRRPGAVRPAEWPAPRVRCGFMPAGGQTAQRTVKVPVKLCASTGPGTGSGKSRPSTVVKASVPACMPADVGLPRNHSAAPAKADRGVAADPRRRRGSGWRVGPYRQQLSGIRERWRRGRHDLAGIARGQRSSTRSRRSRGHRRRGDSRARPRRAGFPARRAAAAWRYRCASAS
jgi:hypothetical protein